ncbi:MAG: hypothetical protein LC798_12990 [Chloroflexi bacterium]|nr:hypothetical protein [Chloroflexota bacterium]
MAEKSEMPPIQSAVAGGVVLDGGAVAPEEICQRAELSASLRCIECGERITTGWEYFYGDAVVVEGQAAYGIQRVALCDREQCKGVEKAQTELHGVMARRAVAYEWLDEEGVDG